MNENTSNQKEKKNLQPEKNKPGLNNGPKFSGYWIYIIIAAIFIGLQFINFGETAKEIDWYKFSSMLRNNEISKLVVINKERVEIYLKKENEQDISITDQTRRGLSAFSRETPAYYFSIISQEKYEENLYEILDELPADNRPVQSSEVRNDYFGVILSWVVPILLLVFIWIFIFKRMSGGAGGGAGNIFNVGKSKAQIFDKDTSVKTDFKDVAGLEEAKTEVREIVDFLKNPKKYTDLGGKIPKGALLVGPPGTGKTLLAKAVAGEAHVPFFSISGSDFVEMFVGVGASRVRDLFRQAKEKAPCIVFIDEIDAVGRARGKNPNFGANDERENTLNQLLTEMDGFSTNSGVIILAATNRADILDRALLRAGRFDRQIHVELPDLNGREEIFKVHIKNIKLDKSVDIKFLARQTPGFSWADIANVCNESALIAARKGKKTVQKDDFLDAVDRIIGGLEKKNKIITQEEKRTIAYHEAGHATISWLLEHANPLLKVTIIPRGRSLGAAWYLPEERQITTSEQMLDEMCATLGGRAAEEVVLSRISTGALNDLERITKTAYAMISYFGMSKLIGNLSYYDSSGQSEMAFNKPYSEKTAERIDEEVKKLIDAQYQRAKDILAKNMEGLKKLAQQLLDKEVIFSEDLEIIFGPRVGKQPEDIRELTSLNGGTIQIPKKKGEKLANGKSADIKGESKEGSKTEKKTEKIITEKDTENNDS
jgi:AFG3 family protein